MRILISTAPLPGHLDWGGLLETARHLQHAGHDVLWASGAAVERVLTDAGINRVDVPVALRLPASDAPLRAARSFEELYVNEVRDTLEIWLTVPDVIGAVEAHIDLIGRWRPDVIVADPMVQAAALAAEATATPLASCGYPGPLATVRRTPETVPLIEELYARVDALRAYVGLSPAVHLPEPALFYVAEALHVVYFLPEWFARYNPLPSPGASYVGGAAVAPRGERPPWLDELSGEKPVVLVTRSTVYGPPSSDLPQIVKAVHECGAFALVAGRCDSDSDPASSRYETWLPFDHVLPRLAAIVHHGGMGTTHAAIRNGVPQLITPAVVDQFLHAERVAAHGAGIAIAAAKLSSDLVTSALSRLLRKDVYRNAAAALRERFAALGGSGRAAELIVALAGGSVRNRSV